MPRFKTPDMDKTCIWCSNRPYEVDLTIEHLLPKSRGGTNELINLAWACRKCNHRRKSMAIGAYLRRLKNDGYTPQLKVIETLLERMIKSSNKKYIIYAEKQLKQLRRIQESDQLMTDLTSSHF